MTMMTKICQFEKISQFGQKNYITRVFYDAFHLQMTIFASHCIYYGKVNQTSDELSQKF